jgi:uncharacterized membrane protein YfcA
VGVPGWVHFLELLTATIALLFLAVLLSAFGWIALLVAAVCAVVATLVGRWLAHRMRHHRYPSL